MTAKQKFPTPTPYRRSRNRGRRKPVRVVFDVGFNRSMGQHVSIKVQTRLLLLVLCALVIVVMGFSAARPDLAAQVLAALSRLARMFDHQTP